MERKQFIDFAKGIAILSVVYLHTIANMESAFYDSHLKLQGIIAYSYMLPVFFIISGAFQRKRLERIGFSHISFIKKISASILVPFYSLSFVFIIINILAGKFIDTPNMKEMITSILFTQSKDTSMPMGILWFLYVLFECSILVYIWIKLLKLNPVLLMVFAFMLNIIFPFSYDNNVFAINYLISFLPYFTTGYVLSKYITKPHTTYLFIFVLFFIYILSLKLVISYDSIYITIIKWTNVTGITASIFILSIGAYITNNFNNSIVSALCYFGRKSIAIYVLHSPMLPVLKKITNTLNLSDSHIGIFMIWIPAFLLPLLCDKALSFYPSIYRILFGRRP